MGSKNKATKKFEAKHLSRTIKKRKEVQTLKHKIANRKAQRKGPKRTYADAEEQPATAQPEPEDESDKDDQMLSDGQLSDDDNDDAASDLEDLAGEEETHKLDIAALKLKDPEFYAFLAENDKELLDFGNQDSDDEAPAPAATAKKSKKKDKKPKDDSVLDRHTLKAWQKDLLQHRSLKTIRQVLLAFRSVTADDDNATHSDFTITDPAVFSKLVTVALKYTPLVLMHHVTYKELPNGKFRLPAQSPKLVTAQRVAKSYFTSLVHLLQQSSDPDLFVLAFSESAKLIPYILGNRKLTKNFLRVLLAAWSEGTDEVRLSAFLVLRKLAVAGDSGVHEMVLKNSYTTLIQTARKTSAHTLPSLNLMKNSAAELYLAATSTDYQLAFGYIRQLALVLRNSIKSKSKNNEAFKTIYNWQFMHSLDFWSLVLSNTCDKDKDGEQSALQPLIYPLVQVALGVIRLIPTSRYFPFRFHCIRALLRLSQRTGIYIPLLPYLLEVLDATEFARKPKQSSLRPLDFEYYIRTPTQYPRTRVYADAIAEEVSFYLLEFFALQSTSIALPEMAIPALVSLKRHLKKTRNQKLSALLKTLVEKLGDDVAAIEKKRSHVEFAPNNRSEIEAFEQDLDASKTALGAYLRLQKKVREAKRDMLEKALVDDEESLAGSDEEEEAMEEDEE